MLYYDNGVTRLYHADARQLPLPDQSVHCVVTSPPYWGLRDYQLAPSVWGGDPECAHSWDTAELEAEIGGGNWTQATNGRGGPQPGGLELASEPSGRSATGSCMSCGAWLGSLGHEPTVDLYVDHLVEIFREVRRVLRRDGICWLNISDSYSGSWGNYNPGLEYQAQRPSDRERWGRPAYGDTRWHTPASFLPQGDRMGIPERLVLSLQADGWTWRDTEIWVKAAPMPESVRGTRWERCRVKVSPGSVPRHGMERGVGHVNESDLSGRRKQKNDDDHIDRRKVGINDRTQPAGSKPTTEAWRLGANPDNPQMGHDGTDFAARARWEDCGGCERCEPNGGYVLKQGSWRCTAAHEYVYMLTKGMGYYSDGEPLRTPLRKGTFLRVNQNGGNPVWNGNRDRQSTQVSQNLDMEHRAPAEGANRRSVWTDIRPEPYPGAHFAVFPSDLPRLCILASTSEAGVCPGCGAPWARVVEKEASGPVRRRDQGGLGVAYRESLELEPAPGTIQESVSYRTTGWKPICSCDAGPAVPATVLDPFAGAATTCLAAQRLGRRSVGTDLSRDYLDQGVSRLSGLTLPLDAAGLLSAEGADHT